LASELDNLENKSPPHKNIRCVAFFQNIFQWFSSQCFSGIY
jgi:hypothetical protein